MLPKETMKIMIFGTVSLILSLGLLFFSLYIIPYLIWDLHYNVPDFVLQIVNYFHDKQDLSLATSSFYLWLIFFIPGVVFGLISYYISKHIDKKAQLIEEEVVEDQKATEETNKNLKESANLGLKIISLMIVIVLVVFLFQYLFNVTPS